MIQGNEFWPSTGHEWLVFIRTIVVSIFGAGGFLWVFLRREIRQWLNQESRDREDAIDEEARKRAAADQRIEHKVERHEDAVRNYLNRVEEMSRTVQTYIGRTETMMHQLHAQEIARKEEMSALREELRVGFAELKSLVRKEQ